MSGSAPVLTDRRLNRTTLSRQLLLDRASTGVLDAVVHLVGLQAQIPQNPYVGLWSRIRDFDVSELEALFETRAVVRMVTMRGTVHLLAAQECRAIRRLTQPVMDAEIARHSEYKPRLVGVDMPAVLAEGRTALAEAGALTNPELRDRMAIAFPDRDPAALAYACRCGLPLVQVPPRGLWTRSGAVRTAHADDWLDDRPDDQLGIDDLVRRYLAAYGPATTADVAAWSRLTGLAEVTGRLDLRRYRDERGRELFDLPDAELIDADAPTKVAFLPEYDNALLSHKHRGRFYVDDAAAGLQHVDGPIQGTALVDGFVSAVWRIDREAAGKRSTLVVSLVRRISAEGRAELEDEAGRLAALVLNADGVLEVRDCPDD